VERVLLVRQLVERLLVVGQLVERLELERVFVVG
jgi:hypothetical protein